MNMRTRHQRAQRLSRQRYTGGKITVVFTPRSTAERWVGGTGIHTCEPYAGPKHWIVEARGGKQLHRFLVVRVGSPTGHCHGSFRIDEILSSSRGDRIVVQGHVTSWPSPEDCLRVSRLNK